MTLTPDVSAAPHPRARPDWLPISIIALAQVLIVSNSTTLSLSIGGIVAEFQATVTAVQSALVAYWLVTAAFMILGGKLGARFGPRQVFRAALLVYAAGMSGVALSRSPGAIIAAEVALGLAAAGLVPSFIALIAVHYRGRGQVFAIGALSAASGAGISVALLVGGAVSSAAGWRAPFWLLAGFALAILLASVRFQPTPPRPGLAIDWRGAGISALAIPLLTVGINNLNTWGVLAAQPGAPFQPLGLSPAPLLMAAGVALIAAFFRWQRLRVARGRAPLLSPVVLDSAMKRAAVTAQLLGIAVYGSIIFLVPLYNQIALGVSPLVSSLRTLPYTVAVLGASILVARLIGPLSVRRLGRLAFVAMAGGLLMCALAFRSPAHDVLFGLGLLLTGLGAGSANTVLANALVASSPRAVAGEVGAVRGTVNNLGGAFGASISGVVLATALSAALAGGLAAAGTPGDGLRMQLAGGQIGFVSDRQLERLLASVGASSDQIIAATAINELARLQALQTAFLVLVGLALLALLLAGLLPVALPRQDAGEQAQGQEEGRHETVS